VESETGTLSLVSTDSAADLALYLHIPFCTSKCGYCDFNSYEGLGHMVPDYTEALVDELALWAPAARDFTVRTVFFGGGTPSLTSLEDMEAITSALRASYDIASDVEWTLEANPGELTREHLEGLRGLGVNRLSIGVQSLHDDELALLDRQHSAERALEAVEAARAAGFDNLNMDLIFGLIGQPLERWQSTLERALEAGPEHLSCYALTVEPGTALYYQVAKGILDEPDPDVVADQYEWTRARLAEAGFEQYEVSNWARPGRACRHNLVYWRAEPYLGLRRAALREHRCAEQVRGGGAGLGRGAGGDGRRDAAADRGRRDAGRCDAAVGRDDPRVAAGRGSGLLRVRLEVRGAAGGGVRLGGGEAPRERAAGALGGAAAADASGVAAGERGVRGSAAGGRAGGLIVCGHRASIRPFQIRDV
jgi:putative oxygen-independent coproporphyrinogen III oxidase